MRYVARRRTRHVRDKEWRPHSYDAFAEPFVSALDDHDSELQSCADDVHRKARRRESSDELGGATRVGGSNHPVTCSVHIVGAKVWGKARVSIDAGSSRAAHEPKLQACRIERARC